jgi:hypothetical protein
MGLRPLTIPGTIAINASILVISAPAVMPEHTFTGAITVPVTLVITIPIGLMTVSGRVFAGMDISTASAAVSESVTLVGSVATRVAISAAVTGTGKKDWRFGITHGVSRNGWFTLLRPFK